MNDVFNKPYYCYGNLLHYENDTNVCTNIWGSFWYHDSNNNSKNVVLMACQSLRKCWILFWATLKYLVWSLGLAV